MSSLLLAVMLFAGAQRPALKEILELSVTARPGPEPWLFPAALVSTSVVLLLPGLLLSAAVSRARGPRMARVCYVVVSSLVVTLMLLDLELLRAIGRRLTEMVGLALQPQAHVAGGDLWSWVGVAARCVAFAVVCTWGVFAVCQRVVAATARGLSPFLRGGLAIAGSMTLLMVMVGPPLLLMSWGTHPIVERLYASSMIDVRPEFGSLDGASNMDPRLRSLYERLRASYKAAFPAITSGRPGDPAKVALPARPPNVVLIVTESLRHDVFGAELMPRLTQWASRGLVGTNHDTGTIYSQSGAFALLYGRSPAKYHQTLDASVPPQFCETLRNSGYECAFFTGHPKEWLRREEFLNPRTMDHFVHDDRGTWPEWDRRALDGMVNLVNASDKPVLAIVLLMSSHFAYEYPPQYEIYKPVSTSTWLVTTTNNLGPEAEIPHWNRYRNCMRFMDDLVADAVARMDPERNIVIFTGDHGESINDDGHYTHGYSFAEVVTRTPFAMVGPGVPSRRLEFRTSHIDVLPSVLHVLAGHAQPIANVHGIDWFADEARSSTLASHSPMNKQKVEAQLRAGGFRLRLDLDLTRPNVRVLGFENELAQPVATPALTDAEMDLLAGAFDEQLSILRR